VITNTANQIRWRWDTSPFGELAVNENPSGLGAFKFNLRFPGQYLDKETNLFYNYFRDYDPQTGRYAQSDPIGLIGGLNTYLYVGADPLSFVDWFGLADGHHWVIGPIRNDPNLSPEARSVFQEAKTGPVPGGHNYGEGHKEYNKGVQELYERWSRENKIDPATMTKAQAEQFVREVKQCPDPRVRNFNWRIYERFIREGFRRMPPIRSADG